MRRSWTPMRMVMAIALSLGSSSTGCLEADGGDGDAGDLGDAPARIADDTLGAPVVDDPPPAPIEASPAWLARQQAYLQACSAENGHEGGSFNAQVCRVLLGETTYAQPGIDAALEKVNDRLDTADFKVATLVRMLYLDRRAESPPLPEAVRQPIEQALLDFRYWLTEQGDDQMCFWTENHQILFHSGELLAGQLFPDTGFSNSGMTGAEHVAHALPLLHRWLDLRGQLGFSEWHSNVYFNEDMPALVNLADFAEDPAIRVKAAMVLDLLAMDLLANMYKGRLATTHGRTYESKFLNGLNDSTNDAAYLMTGLSEPESHASFTGAFLATSHGYIAPPILEALAAAATDQLEHKQRDSLDVAEGPGFGIGYQSTEDVVVWAGMAALAAPAVIDGMTDMLDAHDLWEGFLFGSIPEPYKGMLQDLAGTEGLQELAVELEVVSRGIALEAVDTYTFRTPDYQLSGAQDYKPGFFGAQTQTWLGTLDREAYVFTSYPGEFDEAGLGLDFGGEWIGGLMPRATFHRNVGVIQYRSADIPLLGQYLASDYLHAYFPVARFDAVHEAPPWVFGRKGDGYVALASQHPTRWSEDNDYELITDVTENIWVVELGSAGEHGDFDAFIAAVSAAELTFAEADGPTTWASPSVGEVVVGWDGPMLVAGEPADLGPYARWDNPFVYTERGSMLTVFEDPATGDRLELDFEAAERRYIR